MLFFEWGVAFLLLINAVHCADCTFLITVCFEREEILSPQHLILMAEVYTNLLTQTSSLTINGVFEVKLLDTKISEIECSIIENFSSLFEEFSVAVCGR